MKIFFRFLFLFSCISVSSQTFGLTNKKIIAYYETINMAENKIINNELDSASILYKKAFLNNEQPLGKDLYNSMIVSLKIKDKNHAFSQYRSLKCLEYPFDENFEAHNFPDLKKTKEIKCKTSFDIAYRKTLDSLFIIDQHYRKISGGDYAKYQKEINKNDSIVSTQLLKLIQTKGFPNEYNLGLKSADKNFFQNFYLIVWHQAANNIKKPQVVNFSEDIVKALNLGKITPDNAGFLLDLNNNTNNYSSKHFDIMAFVNNPGDPKRPHDNIEKSLENEDCCYVHVWFLPEKREEKGGKLVMEIDKRRKNLGMCSLDDNLKKKIFNLNNKDYQFPQAQIVGMNFTKDTDKENLKKHFIKIK
ncbi:hypothetical protein AB670_01017 [Chryseobacterium sp. MOF25P]|uniref:hypothetical protein n=1 Tax=unclassified Chryseobacterium TaxID=2593645 RepID=UPI000805B555|nr:MULTISPECIES: hypothetical protein [unclassified Chryseobacterium]OBW42607.1 hypothetical protein AB670_01017 [Chryseobacterium sp. MOF25P]OBW44857.1 hypothetical protein AB671_03053 [Chryseobacterium sp. BGARF1]